MRRWLFLLIALLIAVTAGCSKGGVSPSESVPTEISQDLGSDIGFASEEHLREHYSKHGAEFGSISQSEYLRRALALRDAPVGGPILQIIRADEVRSRFDQSSGEFIAFGQDLTILTFFRPNDGERYFNRQATRPR